MVWYDFDFRDIFSADHRRNWDGSGWESEVSGVTDGEKGGECKGKKGEFRARKG